MSEFEFPFSQVNNWGELFSSPGLLSFDEYRSRIALFSDDHSVGHLSPQDEVDLNILNKNNVECVYFDSDSGKNIFSSTDFSLLCLNIRSLPGNFDYFVTTFLNEFGFPDVIGLCETRLSGDIQQLYSIPGYNGVFNNNSTRCGGVAIYIKSGIKFEVQDQFSHSYNHFESLCLDVCINSKKVTLCMVYRRPGSDYESFLADYDLFINSHIGKKCLVFGDFNLDLLKYRNSSHVQRFVNTNFENNFFSLINRPTRVSSHSATVIDHIWCNFVEEPNFRSGIILTDISDHFATLAKICSLKMGPSSPKVLTLRDWTNLDNGNFYNIFSSNISQDIYSNSDFDVDEALDDLVGIIRTTLDSACPLIQKRIKKRTHKPWITPEIISLTRKKNSLHKKYVRKPITYGDQFRACRNSLNNMIKMQKKRYFNNKLQSCNNDPKKTWDVLNEAMNRGGSKNIELNEIREGNRIVSGCKNVANVINNHFIDAPQTIASSLVNHENVDYRDFLSGYYPNSFFLNTTTPESIVKLVQNFSSSSNGSGHLGIPIKVIKAIIDLISGPLSRIFNKCITEGYFPKRLKIAHIVPIHKSGDRTCPNNYRPISILTIFSKIFEKHLYNELLFYFEGNNIIVDQQCGFRKGVSTNVAIGKFLKRVYSGLNDGKFGIGLFLDLQKAFDMVNHKILMKKLFHYGVRGCPHKLIESFLSERKQYVKINEFESNILGTSIGSPQGSVLSPLLFLIFINDIVNVSSILNFNLFADDTCIYASDSNLVNLYTTLNCEILKVEKWISANLLSLNVSKTVYLLFAGKKCLPNVPPLVMFNTPIIRKTETKFLGIIIDDKTMWGPHTQSVLGKISRVTGIMCKIKDYLSPNSRRLIYYALFYPFIQNGIVFWGTVSKTKFSKIFGVQKRIIRYVAGVGRFEHTEPIFKNLNILKLCDVKKLEISKFVHADIDHNRFFDFNNRSTVHSYNTRNSSALVLPNPRINLMLHSIFYEGLKFFDELPIELKNIDSKISFKIKMKNYLISYYISA